MPSSAGTRLWLPDCGGGGLLCALGATGRVPSSGGLVLYWALESTCDEPSIGGLSRTQPAALAAVSRSVSWALGIAAVLPVGAVGLDSDELSLPPLETSRTTTTTTAIVSSAPSRNCRLRVRFADDAAAASAASRSSRRRRFSSSRLAIGVGRVTKAPCGPTR